MLWDQCLILTCLELDVLENEYHFSGSRRVRLVNNLFSVQTLRNFVNYPFVGAASTGSCLSSVVPFVEFLRLAEKAIHTWSHWFFTLASGGKYCHHFVDGETETLRY